MIDVGADDATQERVAALLPEAHFARMPAGTGFADAANKGLEMVEQVAHVLICHDDVVLEPDAVQLLLEEAYRSNAGLTCPKFVMWDAPDRLASVGMGADHLGVAHQLVEPGELDQGQHDAAREVFLAPSGAVLVRTDLWRALGGFNPGAGSPVEDLDLCWRAQLAGARVVVAPQARARHLEARTKGLRRDSAGNTMAKRDDMSSLSEQQRLRTLWTCYSARYLVLVAPMVRRVHFRRAAVGVVPPQGHSRGPRAVCGLGRVAAGAPVLVGCPPTRSAPSAGERPGDLEGSEPGECQASRFGPAQARKRPRACLGRRKGCRRPRRQEHDRRGSRAGPGVLESDGAENNRIDGNGRGEQRAREQRAREQRARGAKGARATGARFRTNGRRSSMRASRSPQSRSGPR